MEFVSRDGEMVLIRSSFEELQKLAAILCAVREFDDHLIMLHPEETDILISRLEKFDEVQISMPHQLIPVLCSAVNLGALGMGEERFNTYCPLKISSEELEDIYKNSLRCIV
jgi:hypothetical protein